MGQVTAATNSTPSGGTNITADAYNQVAGNPIVVMLCVENWASHEIDHLEDTAGNTYTVIGRTHKHDYQDVAWAWSDGALGNAANAVKVVFAGAVDYCEMFVIQRDDLAATGQPDGTMSSDDNGDVGTTTPITGNTSTSNANDVVFGAIKTFASNNFASWTNSFVEILDTDTSACASLEVSSTGSYGTGATIGGSTQYVGTALAFKKSGGAAADVPVDVDPGNTMFFAGSF